jgi:hypothetical protein
MFVSSAPNRTLHQSLSTLFFFHVPHSYFFFVLEKSRLHSVRKRRNHFDALFLFRPIVALNSGLPSWKMLFVFLVAMSGDRPSNRHDHSARCACAANAVGNDLDIFQSGPFLSITIYDLVAKIVNNI